MKGERLTAVWRKHSPDSFSKFEHRCFVGNAVLKIPAYNLTYSIIGLSEGHTSPFTDFYSLLSSSTSQ